MVTNANPIADIDTISDSVEQSIKIIENNFSKYGMPVSQILGFTAVINELVDVRNSLASTKKTVEEARSKEAKE